MRYSPEKQRRSIRLPGYDYASPGAYFVTVCVHGGECLLGEVVDDEMRLNQLGQVAHSFWTEVPIHFPSVSVDTFAIMPNHLHAIVVIQAPATVVEGIGKGEEGEEGQQGEEGEETSPLQVGDHAGRGAVTAPTLGQIVAYYKYQTTIRINQVRDMPGVPFWQRNYWEHIIRNDESLDRIQEYIETNPARWDEDQFHPTAPPNAFNQWSSAQGRGCPAQQGAGPNAFSRWPSR